MTDSLLPSVPPEVEQWRRKTPKCLFCLDVRIGTMALAIFQIILHVIALSLFLIFILHPEAIHHLIPKHCLKNIHYGSIGYFSNFDRQIDHLDDHYERHMADHLKHPMENHHERHMDKHHHGHMDNHHHDHHHDHWHNLIDSAIMPSKMEIPAISLLNNVDKSIIEKPENDVLQSKIEFQPIHSLNIRAEPLFANPIVHQVGSFEFHHPNHIANIRLLAFGHRETIIFKNNNGEPSMFLARMLEFPPRPQLQEQTVKFSEEMKPTMSILPASKLKEAKTIQNSVNSGVTVHNSTSKFCFFKHGVHRYLKLLVVSLSLVFCILLFYGAKYRRPIHLIPYFTMQVFGYIMLLFVVVGYLSYLPNFKYWIQMQCNFPLKHTLLSMNNMLLAMIMILCSGILLTIKAYLIGIVWRCYHHLRLGKRVELLARSRNAIFNSDVIITLQNDSDEKKLIIDDDGSECLPKYEKCLEIPANSFMPPPYFENVNENKKETG